MVIENESRSEPTVPQATGKLFTADFVLLCVGSIFFYFSFHMLLPTLPTYILKLGGDERQVGLIIGAFATSALLCRLPIGWLLDRSGATKGLIVAGTLLFLASSILYGFARTVLAVLAIRFLHGAGMGAYNTASSTLAAHITPVRRRGEGLGIFGMASNLSMAVGPAAGVAILGANSYSLLFGASAAAALIGVALALPLRNHSSFESHATHRRRGAFYSREALFPSAVIFLACLTYGVMVSFLPLFAIERELGNAGLFFLPFAVSVAAARAPAGRLSDRYGRAALIAPGMALVAGAMALLSHTHALCTLMTAAVIYGVGFACAHSPLMALAVDRTPPNERGIAMGTFTAAWELGIAGGSVFSGYLLAATSFETMFLAAAAAAVLGGVVFTIGNVRNARDRR